MTAADALSPRFGDFAATSAADEQVHTLLVYLLHPADTGCSVHPAGQDKLYLQQQNPGQIPAHGLWRDANATQQEGEIPVSV